MRRSRTKNLLQYQQYIDFPWPSKNIIQKTKPEEPIGILGSSLSAIDAAMTLIDHDHTGQITFFSPHGMMPRVQPESERNYTRRFLTREIIHQLNRESHKETTIKELFKMFKDEVEDYGGGPIDWKTLDRICKPPEKLLKENILCSENGGDGITTVAYSLRENASPIWSALGVAEKQRIKKKMVGSPLDDLPACDATS